MAREDVRGPIVGEALRLDGSFDRGVKPLLQDKYSDRFLRTGRQLCGEIFLKPIAQIRR